MMGIPETSRKTELLKLPEADNWMGRKWWDRLLVVTTRRKHDSGYAMMAIIGVGDDGLAQEILTCGADIIHWPADARDKYINLRTDTIYPTGVQRIFGYNKLRLEWNHTSDATIELGESKR